MTCWQVLIFQSSVAPVLKCSSLYCDQDSVRQAKKEFKRHVSQTEFSKPFRIINIANHVTVSLVNML